MPLPHWLRIAHQAEIGYTARGLGRSCICGCGLPTRPRLVTLARGATGRTATVADCPPGRDWLHAATRHTQHALLRIAHQAEIGYTCPQFNYLIEASCGLPTRPRLVTLDAVWPSRLVLVADCPPGRDWLHSAVVGVTTEAVADCPPGRDWLHFKPADGADVPVLRIAHQAEIGYTPPW